MIDEADALQGIWDGFGAHWEAKLGLVVLVVLLNLTFSRLLAQGQQNNTDDLDQTKTVLLVTG